MSDLIKSAAEIAAVIESGFNDVADRLHEEFIRRDPRIDTHGVRDYNGVVHRLVSHGGDGRWEPFCVRMDAIETAYEGGDTETLVSIHDVYPESDLVPMPLTCLRCMQGLVGWP